MADSIPILAITGQAPVAKLHKEDFQSVDIAAIAAPVTKWAVTVMEAAQVPGTLQKAFWLMRMGRPGPVLVDLPIDVQLAEIEFDADSYEPLPVARPAATRAHAERVLDLLEQARHPVIVAGGGIVNADEGLGCKALRVRQPDDILPALETAKKLMAEYQVPVIVEVILERVTNIAMGTALDAIVEFEDIATRPEDAPTAARHSVDQEP